MRIPRHSIVLRRPSPPASVKTLRPQGERSRARQTGASDDGSAADRRHGLRRLPGPAAGDRRKEEEIGADPETPAEAEEFLQREGELRAFLAGNPGREPVLYFGDAAYYKGYDLFLQFIATTPSTCAIHAGRTYDTRQRGYFQHDVDVLRARLKREGRLYETNAYVHTQRLKELFFGTVRLYITTHRLALSSSTVIQALEMGKPVLVPDRGLLGYRVRTNNLGDVYAYEELSDLSRKAEILWRSDLARFTAPALSFWERFSDESIRDFFVRRLLGSKGRN